MAGKEQPQTIDLATLQPQQLLHFKEQLEQELQGFAQSSMTLGKAAGDFGKSGRSLEALAQQEPGQPMLIPLTSLLYVSGSLADNEKVLIDIGTGYYVERTTSDGVDYCKRKVNLLRDNVEKIGQMIKRKQQALAAVENVLEMKAAEASQSQGQSSS